MPSSARPSAAAAPFTAVRPLVLDLDRPAEDIDAAGYPASEHSRGRVLVRRDGRPVGVVDVPLEDGRLSDLQVEALRVAYAEAPTSARLSAATEPEPVTVVIATHDRPRDLRRCLQSVLAMDHPHVDVVVVDSAPSSGATAAMVREDFPDVSYLHEPVPGLAQAHNRGLELVATPVVAFTDDDVVVDRAWARWLSAPFAADPSVGCVTGLIWPAELETAAQLLIDAHGRYGKGFEPRKYDLAGHRPADPLFPYTVGQLGSGANMAFRTATLADVGGFDPALGAGSIGRGGDDLAAFHDVLTAGWSVVYEPAAVVHHRHRREYDDLRSQARNYGAGLSAYLTAILLRDPAAVLDFARLAPRGLRHLAQTQSGMAHHRDDGARTGELSRLELLGMLEGPLAYVRSRRFMASALDGARA